MGKYTVKQKRMELQMTLADLQKACRVDTSLLSRLENGRYVPTVDEQRRIANALGCTSEEILFPQLKTAYGI